MSFSPAIREAAALLKKWGVPVAVHGQAERNGRPYEFTPLGVVAHHTASNRNSSESATRNVIINGRSDVKGPLSQFFVARDGTVDVITFGRANHAGLGGPWRSIPRHSGNRYLVGVEVDNNGTNEPYPPEQLRNARLVYAALLIALKRDENWLLGHKEWAPGRKIDPKLNMDREREAVARVIAEKLAPPKPPTEVNDEYVVKKGDTLWGIASRFNTSVEWLVRVNKLHDADELRVGQKLRIPGKRTHTVAAGDTLWSISRKYDASLTDLARLNGIGDVSDLQIGQVLRLP